MLERKAWVRFEAWKNTKKRQGLLVTGARQVGKTYLIREFGKKYYTNVAEINLIENRRAAAAIDTADNAAELFARISLLANARLVPGETLIFIDEVQVSKEIITAIKFLVEQTQYDFILSGSLLGVELRDIRSVPVGSLDTVEMFPLDFEEFCGAAGMAKELLQEAFSNISQRIPVNGFLHEQLMKRFHEYLIIGGMPAAVSEFCETHNLQSVRLIQQNIIFQNKRDISQYSKDDALKIKEIYEMIPAQLNQQNKRFILKSLDERALFRQYADSIAWLTQAGVAIPVFRVAQPVYPLKLSGTSNLFKLFMGDVGLLTSTFMKDVSIEILAKNTNMNYGAIYENVVAQELKAGGFDVYYYNSKKHGELDFVTESVRGRTIPIEVKSGKDYKRHNALTNLMGEAGYKLGEGIVLCESNIRKEWNITYLPVYAAGHLD